MQPITEHAVFELSVNPLHVGQVIIIQIMQLQYLVLAKKVANKVQWQKKS